MLLDTTNQISTLIKEQFPAFYQEDGPLFIAFVDAYYEWLQLPGNPIGVNRELPNYRDLDLTLDQFLVFFKDKYLPDIQFTTETNKRLLIKNNLDLYRSKGSPRSVDLLFRLVFGIPASIYYPDDDVLRLDDNEWIQPTYLEVTQTANNILFVGQQITGLGSGATAFVERLVRKNIKSKYINVFYLSNVTGQFRTNEMIKYNDNVVGLPVVIGSLSAGDVIAGGELFKIGDVVDIVSGQGEQAQALVTGISEITGIVDFQLFDGGWGYQLTDPIYVSDKVLSITNVNITNTSIANTFILLEQITQPVGTLNYIALAGSNSLPVGTVVEEYNSAGNVIAFGTVLQTTTINSTAGTITVAPSTFANGLLSDLTANLTIHAQGNGSHATESGYSNISGKGILIGYAANNTLDVGTVTGSYSQGEVVFQGELSSNSTASGKILSISSGGIASTTTLSLTNCVGTFYIGQPVIGISSGASASLQDFSTTIGVINTVNAFVEYPGNYIIGNSSNTTGLVFSVSRGALANVSIGSIGFPQQVTIGSDLLNGTTTGGVPFMSMLLDGSNSNVASNGYGFVIEPTVGYNNTVYDSLSFNSATVGSIGSLANVNPGVDYTAAPFDLAYDQLVACLNLRDYKITVTGETASFIIGEQVNQTISIPNVATLTVTAANTFQVGEAVFVSNSTANVATGRLHFTNIAANSGTMIVNNVTGVFTPGDTLHGKRTNGRATIGTVNITPLTDIASGIVKAANDSMVIVKRISFAEFNVGNTIIGQITGAIATPTNVEPDLLANPIGLNADIESSVQTSTGAVTSIDIINSGFGFSNGELASFQSLDHTRSGSVQLKVQHQGQSLGYFKSHAGMLDDDGHFFDGVFYQQYAYQVLSRLPFDKYKNMLRRVLHPVGTVAFGRVILEANTKTTIDAYNYTEVGQHIDRLNVSGMSNGAMFVVGDTVLQNSIPVGSVVGNGHMAIITTNGQFYPIKGTHIAQPNLSSNTISGTVTEYNVNAISNTTIVYVNNQFGTFAQNNTTTFFDTVKIDNQYIARIKLSSVISNVYTTGSFANGETVYQGPIDATISTGTIVAANAIVCLYQPISGSVLVGSQLIGETTGASANVESYNGDQFTTGQTLYIQETQLALINVQNANASTHSFMIGENVYQNTRSKEKSISFSNTAVAHVVAANSSTINVRYRFGNFSNNAIISGDQSNTTALISRIANTDIAYGNTVSVNSTVTVVGQLSHDNSINVTSNTLIYTGTPNARSYAIASGSTNKSNTANTSSASIINRLFVQTIDGKAVDINQQIKSGNSTANATIVSLNLQSL